MGLRGWLCISCHFPFLPHLASYGLCDWVVIFLIWAIAGDTPAVRICDHPHAGQVPGVLGGGAGGRHHFHGLCGCPQCPTLATQGQGSPWPCTLKVEWYCLVSRSVTQQTFPVFWEMMYHLTLVLTTAWGFRGNRYHYPHSTDENIKAEEAIH